MKDALLIQAFLMIVLVTAGVLQRSVWRMGKLWPLAIGGLMLATFLIANVNKIEDGWLTWLTVGMILKNVSLTAILAELFLKRPSTSVSARVGDMIVSVEKTPDGHSLADAVESIRSSSRLAAVIRAGAASSPGNGNPRGHPA